jgi:hypothetical protein
MNKKVSPSAKQPEKRSIGRRYLKNIYFFFWKKKMFSNSLANREKLKEMKQAGSFYHFKVI